MNPSIAARLKTLKHQALLFLHRAAPSLIYRRELRKKLIKNLPGRRRRLIETVHTRTFLQQRVVPLLKVSFVCFSPFELDLIPVRRDENEMCYSFTSAYLSQSMSGG